MSGDDRVARTFAQRAWQLLHDHNPTWLEPMGMNLWGVRYRRGFLEEVRTRSDILMAHAPWFALQPILALDCEPDDATATELRRALRASGLIWTATGDLERLTEFNAQPHATKCEQMAAAGGRLAGIAGLQAVARLRSFRWSVPSHLYRRWAGR
jgi:hypothetical protein